MTVDRTRAAIRQPSSKFIGTQPWDLWAGPVFLGKLVVGSSTVLMEPDGYMVLPVHTDASSTFGDDAIGRFFTQTTAAPNDVANGIRVNSTFNFLPVASLPWMAGTVKLERVTDVSYAVGWGTTDNYVVVESDTNPAAEHIAIGFHTTRGDTTLQVLHDSGTTTQVRTDTSIAIAQLLTGIRFQIRFLSTTSCLVTIRNPTTNAILYEATIDADVPTADVGWFVGAAPRDGGGAVDLGHYYHTIGLGAAL